MDDKVFDEWLRKNLGYTDRSARDTRSRVKRASKYIDLTKNVSKEELIFTMTQHPDFRKLTTSVKSQLKRSVKLYLQFLNEKNS